MRYRLLLDIEPGQRPVWSLCRRRVGRRAIFDFLRSGSGFDLTQCLVRAGAEIIEDTKECAA